MKKIIRNCVFETNSSLTHSCIIMMEEQSEKWKEGDLYYYPPHKFYNAFEDLSPDKQPQGGCLYAQDEVIKFYKLIGYAYDPSKSSKEDFIKEMGDFIGYYDWVENEYLYCDTETFTTPNGEKIVVYCQYGGEC